MTQFDGVLNNACYDWGSSQSIFYDYPNGTIHTGSDCTGAVTDVRSLDEEDGLCVATETPDDDDRYIGYYETTVFSTSVGGGGGGGSSSEDDDKPPLSSGAIAGIVVGAVAAVVWVGVAAYIYTSAPAVKAAAVPGSEI